MDTRLLGTWRCSSTDPESPGTALVAIVRFDKSQYYVDWKEGEELKRYRAYPSRIGRVVVLNVEELDGRFNPWPWAIVRATVDPAGVLSLKMVNGDLLVAKNEKAVVQEIRRRIGDEAIYLTFARCTTVQE